MDRNFLLATALSLAVFSAWLAWQAHVHPPLPVASEVGQLEKSSADSTGGEKSTGQSERVADGEALREKRNSADERAEVSPRIDVETAAGDSDAVPAPRVEPWTGRLENDLVSAEFSNRGGVLRSWKLQGYFETPARKIRVELIDLPSQHEGVLLTPFDELGIGDLSQAMYEVVEADTYSVHFELQRAGLRISKIYRLDEDGYGFELAIDVENRSNRAVQPEFEILWPVGGSSRPDFGQVSVSALVDGKVEREMVASIGRPGLFSRFFGDGDEGPSSYDENVLWAGLDLRYFAGVLIPQQKAEVAASRVVFEALEEGKLAAVSLSEKAFGSQGRIEPGQSSVRRYLGFLGPKHRELLQRVGWNLEKTVNSGYSWVSPLTTFFGWALHAVHRVVPNYGLAIILITLLVRLATWPVMAKQMRSSERMRELMPRIKEIQSQYKDDRQRQSEETFKLYRETGVNPLGGCLPMLLQLPVFIGLFYALQSSIDLRHAPFVLWINDLSAPATAFTLPGVDFPVRILPIIMAVSMLAQQKMMPQAGTDPAQQKMMLIMMPGMMGVISYGFPSGLVLYWMVSNLLGIGHQLLVRRRMQREGAEA